MPSAVTKQAHACAEAGVLYGLPCVSRVTDDDDDGLAGVVVPTKPLPQNFLGRRRSGGSSQRLDFLRHNSQNRIYYARAEFHWPQGLSIGTAVPTKSISLRVTRIRS